MRGPDIALIRKDRVPKPSPTGFAAFPPDLVIEIRSPSDRPGDVLGKVADYLSAGTALVWVIDPTHRVTHVYRQDGTEALLRAEEVLDGEDVLPGLLLSLRSIFQGRAGG